MAPARSHPAARKLGVVVFFVVMALGWVFIADASRVYFDSEMLAPFVLERLPVRFEGLWMNSLTIHVASAVAAFPLCLLLMTRWMQRRRLWHRWLGRTSGVIVLLALVPSGFVLAFEAKGGAPVTAGFLLTGSIVGCGMVAGVVAARQKRLESHAWAMRHVTAQMSVAVTSRGMLIAADLAGVDPDLAYVAALWIPVIGSAAVAEGLSSWPLLRRLRRPFTSSLGASSTHPVTQGTL